MSGIERSDRNFPALTSLRAVAAYMVFISHFAPGVDVVGGFVHSILIEFHIGVPIFFVLSGFLIFLRYSEKSTPSRDFLFGYYRNRAAKIYPVYFFLILCTALLSYLDAVNGLGLRQEMVNLLLQFSFLKGYSYRFFPVGIGQAWTLTIEETFYFAFPFIVMLLRRLGYWKSLMVVYVMGLVLLAIGNTVRFHGFFEGLDFMAFYTFFGRAGEFFLGMWMASRFMRRSETSARRCRIPYRTIAGVLGILLCLLVFSLRVSLSQSAFLQPVSHVLDSGTLASTVFTLTNNFLLPPFVALLLYGLLTESSIIRAVLEMPFMVLLGKASYSFYLIHLGFFETFVVQRISDNPVVLFLLANCLAVFLFLVIEEPWRHVIRGIGLPAKWATRGRSEQRGGLGFLDRGISG